MAKAKILRVDEAAARLGKPVSQRKPVQAAAEPAQAAAEPAQAAAEPAQAAAGPAPKKKKPAGSAAMRLAAEVDRLQAELLAARDRVTELEAMADVDVLLNILNRRSFERELRRAAAYVRRYGTAAALLYLDLDYFKPMNDRYGHAVGDSMLQAVAKTLQRTVRESDVVARLGGDEFGVLVWNVSEIQAAAKARELESAVAATVVMHADAALSVGVSAGFAMLGPGDEPRDIISRADMAMYARKRAGRARAG